MNRAILLGGLFLHASSVYAGATHGDLIAEGRKRNEEAYERTLEETGWKNAEQVREEKANTPHESQKISKSLKLKSS